MSAQRTDTHCPYCALQCAMTISTDYDGAPPVISGRDFPTNRGGLCRKGWSAAELLDSPERLTSPMRRLPNREFVPVSWDEALEMTAGRLAEIREEHGPDALGVFGSGGLTNEKAYQLGKFARLALGTSRINYNGRFCMSSAAAASNRAFGLDRGLPFPLEDLGQADTIVLFGSNVADTMPPFVQHLASAREHGGLIVVDPRRSATAALTDSDQGQHVQPKPGTDLELLLGLSHLVIAEGYADLDYLQNRVNGLEALTYSVSSWFPERTAQVTGVPVTTVRDIAQRLAQAKNCYILTGRGIEQHANGTATATAAINLSLLLGLPGRLGSGYGTLTGQGNGQGGREHGQKSDQLPGYRKITDPHARHYVAGVWGVPEQMIPGPGLPAVAMLKSLGQPEGIRALLVHGSNIAVSAPDRNQVVAGLRALDFLVVCDFFFSETAAEADLVLPVGQWAEEEGTMTNLEGRVIRRRRSNLLPAGVKDELWVLRELALRLSPAAIDANRLFSADPQQVFAELAEASRGGIADYSGITYADLDAGKARYWPCPQIALGTEPAEPEGTPRLFLDRFMHPDGRALLVPATRSDFPDRKVVPLAEAGTAPPLTLLTGRLLEHYQSGTQTRRVAQLQSSAPVPLAQIHPATALGLGLADKAQVRIYNSRGEVNCAIEFSENIGLGTLFLPFHFADKQAANQLTEALADPISGMPEFKTSTVWVQAVSAQADLGTQAQAQAQAQAQDSQPEHAVTR